jgi:hypothetical protein
MEYIMLKANNLFSQRENIKARIDAEKKKLSEVDNQIKDLYLPVGKDQLGAEDKDFGTTTVNLPEGKAKVTIAKKVDWDQKKLIELGNKIDPELANTFIKYSVKIDENMFKTMAPNWKEYFSEARTVKEGTITINSVEEN